MFVHPLPNTQGVSYGVSLSGSGLTLPRVSGKRAQPEYSLRLYTDWNCPFLLHATPHLLNIYLTRAYPTELIPRTSLYPPKWVVLGSVQEDGLVSAVPSLQ
jgi:hypothetical protein